MDYDFQLLQDGFGCSFDYRLVNYDFKQFPRCARPVPFIKVFRTAFPLIKIFMTAFPFIKRLINNFRTTIFGLVRAWV